VLEAYTDVIDTLKFLLGLKFVRALKTKEANYEEKRANKNVWLTYSSKKKKLKKCMVNPDTVVWVGEHLNHS
jgi:hypothetical protein